MVRLSAATAQENGITDIAKITGPRGTVTLPVVLTDMPDRVVWMPECSPGSLVHETLGSAYGQLVSLKAAEA